MIKILVDRLNAIPTAFQFELAPDWAPEAAPFGIDLRAHTMGEDLLVEGRLSGDVDAECSRCLARYRHALREEFRLLLEPAGERVPADPESAQALTRDGVCFGEEIEAGWYRGESVDLDGYFGELVALAMPIALLCREDCAGLCSQCGTDRNRSTCDCADSKPDSPFAVLAALRGQGSEGEI